MFQIKGQVLGTKTVDMNGQNGPYQRHYVGFQAPKENGFPGEMITVEVQITKSQYDKGLMAAYEGVKGQEVVAPVFGNPFVSKSGPNVQWFFSGDGRPKAVK